MAYAFPSSETLLQYGLQASPDRRWAAADAPLDWELQCRNGSDWTVLDRQFDAPLWRPSESRVYSLTEGVPAPCALFRLVVFKVPGRSTDQSFVSLASFRFLTESALPSACDALPPQPANSTLAIAAQLKLVGSPAVGINGSAPFEQLALYVNLTNTGATPLGLRSLHIPVRVSLAVQAFDGSWALQPASSFLPLACWGAYIATPPTAAMPFVTYSGNLCGAAGGVSASLTAKGVMDLVVDDTSAGPSLLLCPGCSLGGPPDGGPMLVLQHSTFGRIDVDSAVAAANASAAPALLCGAAGAAALNAMPPLPGPPGVERHPACAPWAGRLRPAAAAAAAPACAASLPALRASVQTSFGAGGSELRVRPLLLNTAPTSVPLFGASFGVLFPAALAGDGADSPPRPASEWSVECWYGVLRGADGSAAYGARSPCEYLVATVQEAPARAGGPAMLLLNVTFLGGELCAGCSIAAGGTGQDDALLDLKHSSYAPLGRAPPPRLKPGGVVCAAPPAPPARCVSAASPPAR